MVLWRRVRSNKSLQVQSSLLAQGAVVLSSQIRCCVAVKQTTGEGSAGVAGAAAVSASTLSQIGWMRRYRDVAQAVNCHGESGLAIAAHASEITFCSVVETLGSFEASEWRSCSTSRRLRTRGLEQSLSVVGLAEVTQVGPRSATLTPYAGPGQGDMTDMMAVPMAAFTL